MDAFSLFQSETSIFNDEETSFTSFPGAKKARTMLQLPPKYTMTPPSNKKQWDKQTSKIRSAQHIQISDSKHAYALTR
jgi:hypothetical protein